MTEEEIAAAALMVICSKPVLEYGREKGMEENEQ